ncbi:hypothetical protein WG904_05945 [Pedobacter sp. Du54]|uniref:hypothetical protein n=1 Tax=Pedobacter anseongensis TaxID=3133439 RepID=UPI00309D466B
MKNSLLLPNKYKVLGWIIFLIAAGLHLLITIFDISFPKVEFQLIKGYDWADASGLDEILFSFVLIGLLLISFAKEKNEDEYISFLRLKSWQWAVLISYGILFFANWLIYGTMYLAFMVYNMFTVLLVFIIKFNYSLYMLKRGDKNEN